MSGPCVGWFLSRDHLVGDPLQDNGPSYRSGDWRKRPVALGLKPHPHQAYHAAGTNGKAERLSKTSLAGMGALRGSPTKHRMTQPLATRYLGIF